MAQLSVYERALDLAKESASPFAVWKARDDLAGLYLLLENRELLREQQMATDAARQGDSEIILRMALTAEALLLLRLERPTEAAIRVCEGLAIPDLDDIDQHGKAALRTLHGECEALHGRVDQSPILIKCWPYLEAACRMTNAAGIHSTMCRWWCVEVRCCELENHSAKEVDALQKSLAIARQIYQLPHVAGVYTKASVARVIDRLAKALWRNGNIDEAQSASQEVRRIRMALWLPATATRANSH